ncbi:GyrI-like domain-containing protein [Roseovarius sp. EL26]|uniref:AraC family transcriptional regulator n=1 Tax=Roseovarius sp. EL26 TaxID=2126672 RepID=UPI000EA19BBD|nr:AraC family transcriptional regulator [Roseovarius sp. EL26]
MQREILQRHKMNRVINYVRSSDAEAITLSNLADVACLSRYHFTRVFTEYCHETPVEFASRICLEKAVSNLIFLPGKPITTIALEAGFSSSQSFSNAFNRRFGISPRKFRNKNTGYVYDFPNNQYVLSPVMSKLPTLCDQSSPDWNVEIKTLPATRLAYIRTRSGYYNSSTKIETSFSRLIDWAKTRGLLQEDRPIIGVCPDDPAVTPPQFCQYDIGIPVEHGVTEDEHICIQYLPEVTLATLEVTGSELILRKAWRWLISQWLPQSGLLRGHADYYEVFRLQDIPLKGADAMGTICVPVLAANKPNTRLSSAQDIGFQSY